MAAEPWEKVFSGSVQLVQLFNRLLASKPGRAQCNLSKCGVVGSQLPVLVLLQELASCLVAPGNCAVASAAVLLLKQWPRKLPFYELPFQPIDTEAPRTLQGDSNVPCPISMASWGCLSSSPQAGLQFPQITEDQSYILFPSGTARSLPRR